MSKWRPEGWFNPNISLTTKQSQLALECHEAFEDGADAILETLRSNPIDLKRDWVEIFKKGGRLVFIPNDETEIKD